QRWFSYLDFLIRFLNYYNINKEDAIRLKRVVDLCYPKCIKNLSFINNTYYNNIDIEKFQTCFMKWDNSKNIRNKRKQYYTKTPLSSSGNNNNIIKRLDIPDIEDLINNKLPPCIRNASKPKIHLKNQDRLTLSGQYSSIGIEWDNIIKIHRNNDASSLSELKKQYNYEIRKRQLVQGSFPCHSIFNTPGHSGFSCPYEAKYREGKKKKDNEKYELTEKDEILEECRKCNGTKHNSPAEFIVNKLNIVYSY